MMRMRLLFSMVLVPDNLLAQIFTIFTWFSVLKLDFNVKLQACGLIHAITGQYIDALDSYMKDFNEPVHAFVFINKMLVQLKNTNAFSFRSAVISRIPELVKLSRYNCR